MVQTALQGAIQTKVIPINSKSGVLTHVELNYHEVQCIELALIGLAEHIRNNDLPDNPAKPSMNHLKAQLNYLRHWLNQPALRAQLRLEGSNTVLWPFTSSELVDWLLAICQSCITIDAILIAAADASCYEYAEFSETYLENNDNYSLADEMHYCNFSAFQHYYNDIVTSCQATLVGKLMRIQAQNYPLFPTHSAMN